jgi:hypothetical protein
VADFNLSRHTIGFVIPEKDRARALGSGTLLSFGRVEGILTAAHVLDEIVKVDEIGLLAFPVRADQAQRLRLQTQYTERVRIAGEAFSEYGPNLAFLRLPDKTIGDLKANSSFVNFQKQLAIACSGPPAETDTLDAVVGVVAEWSDEKPFASGSLDITNIRGLLNVGSAIEIARHDGFDRLEFTPLPANGFKLPSSYGGTSGGGVWRAFTQSRGDDKKYLKELRLIGVAFFEGPRRDGSQTILCHGPKSIYDRLAANIQERWAAELDLDNS